MVVAGEEDGGRLDKVLRYCRIEDSGEFRGGGQALGSGLWLFWICWNVRVYGFRGKGEMEIWWKLRKCTNHFSVAIFVLPFWMLTAVHIKGR